MKFIKTIKAWDRWMGFWVVWNIGFFIKNLIEGDLMFMFIFAVMAIIQAVLWKVLRPGMVDAYARNARIDAEMAEAREKWLR